MGLVKITVRALGPLYLGSVRSPVSNTLRSERYLPGGVLRAGLVAARKTGLVTEAMVVPWLDPDPSSNAGTATLPHLYPTPLEASGAPGPLALVTPASAYRCKKKGGLPTAGSTERSADTDHGAVDLLLHELAFQLACGAVGATVVPIPFERRCGAKENACSCGEPLTPLEATWIAQGARGWGQVSTEVLRHTRVAIQRERRSAQDGLLFSVESLPPESCFSGLAWVPDKARGGLEKALSSITHLGGRQSGGYGAVAITVTDVKAEVAGKAALEQRITAFNDRLRRLYDGYRTLSDSRATLASDRRFFSVDLHSPVIRTDEADADTLALPAKALVEAMEMALRETGAGSDRITKGLAKARLEGVAHQVAPQRIGGWHTGRRLPTPVRLGARAGSYHVFETTEADLLNLIPGLVALERVGMGERREDGFGRVVACHPFHLETGTD